MERIVNGGASPTTISKVKEVVDFIFEATVGGGYKGGWTKYPARFRAIAAILKKRGILVREGNKRFPIQKWFNPSMTPTKNLYKSIADELVLSERESSKKTYMKSKKEKTKAMPVVETPIIAPIMQTQSSVLDGFSDQELYDELKRRGYCIEDNKLVVVKRTYLD